MADNMDVMSPEYEKTLFESLAPQVEAEIRKMFPATRGANFGAMQSILAGRLAKLRTEIALHAATQRTSQAERLRQEQRQERLYNERKSSQEGEKSRLESQRLNEESRKRSWAEMDYMRSKSDYDRYLAEQKAAAEAKSERDLRASFFDVNAPDHGESKYLAYKRYMSGKSENGDDQYKKIKKDWEDRVDFPENPRGFMRMPNMYGMPEQYDPAAERTKEFNSFIQPQSPFERRGPQYGAPLGPTKFRDPQRTASAFDDSVPSYSGGGSRSPIASNQSPSYEQKWGSDPDVMWGGQKTSGFKGNGDITQDTFSKWPKKYAGDITRRFRTVFGV